MNNFGPERQIPRHQETHTSINAADNAIKKAVLNNASANQDIREVIQTENMLLYLPTASGRSEVLEQNGYQVKKVLTRTSNATILYGTDQFGKEVAIKMIPFSNRQERKMIEQEAARSGLPSLSNDTVAAQDVFLDNEAGYGFIVMEWFNPHQRPTLEMLHRKNLLDADLIIDIFDHLTQILTKLDQEDLIHLDLKPGNIFVEFDDVTLAVKRVWLGDFATAKTKKEVAKKTDVIHGTFPLLPPERMLASNNEPAIDHRADIYSLTAVLHHLLTKRLYFFTKKEMINYAQSEDKNGLHYSMYQSIQAFHRGEIELFTPNERAALENQGINVPELERVIKMGLENNPADRFDNYRALYIAVARTQSNKGKLKDAVAALEIVEATDLFKTTMSDALASNKTAAVGD